MPAPWGASPTTRNSSQRFFSRDQPKARSSSGSWPVSRQPRSFSSVSTGWAALQGAGKTTAALLLAFRGHQLLANDRVFVRPAGDDLCVLPWPSAAAIGLGLLDALGLYDVVRERLEAGEQLHPTQPPDVTAALFAGRRKPLWEGDGRRERKVQVFLDQFPGWFGIDLSTGGHVAGLLFPRIDPDGIPAVVEGGRTLGEGDLMSGATEDRYPDVFGLAHGIDGGGRGRQ
ncbi:hypothetical protein [Streptomyces ossamyceticus]|uniref:hypothetical protein n=1 Tax=Streptomyces ossamyceticus TaxID=249581 RepID=UPI003EBEE12F